MKLFFEYLRKNFCTLLLFAVFGIIFLLILFLSDIPVLPVVYSLALCIFIGLIFGAFDFFLFIKKHREIRRVIDNADIALDQLPECHNLIESDYAELVRRIDEIKRTRLASADAAKGDMTDYYTMWVHQIKTPIAAMRLLLQGSASAEKSELENELFRIEEYAEMVLIYLRLDSDSSDLVINKCRLADIIKGAVRKYARLFIRKRLSLNFEDFEYTVLTDEKWLSFIIEQVLSNSLKYTEAGSVSIYMQGDSLIIEDTGIGIADEDLPRIFERGYTGYNGRIDKKSTGIGLYLCRRTAKKLGHSISAESTRGAGTKIIIGFEQKEMVFE